MNTKPIKFEDWLAYTRKMMINTAIFTPVFTVAGVLVWNLWASEKVSDTIKPLEKRVTTLENVVIEYTRSGRKTELMFVEFLKKSGEEEIVKKAEKMSREEAKQDSLRIRLGKKPKVLDKK